MARGLVAEAFATASRDWEEPEIVGLRASVSDRLAAIERNTERIRRNIARNDRVREAMRLESQPWGEA